MTKGSIIQMNLFEDKIINLWSLLNFENFRLSDHVGIIVVGKITKIYYIWSEFSVLDDKN